MSGWDMPVIGCDDPGGCDEWTPDYYAQAAHSVDGVRVTKTQRAPGWVRRDIDGVPSDLCPQHVTTTDGTTT